MASTSTKDMEDLVVLNHVQISKEKLEGMMNEILEKDLEQSPENRKEIERLISVFQKDKAYRVRPAKRQLLHIYRHMCDDKDSELEYEIKYEYLLQCHPVRSNSGVLVCAVVLSPTPNGQNFTCQWDCYYCPNQPGQPRSYLKEEPGVARANQYGFDPYMQIKTRLDTNVINGHTADKLEIIVLGGTWESYPDLYQYEFIGKLYYAANEYFNKEKLPYLSPEDEEIAQNYERFNKEKEHIAKMHKESIIKEKDLERSLYQQNEIVPKIVYLSIPIFFVLNIPHPFYALVLAMILVPFILLFSTKYLIFCDIRERLNLAKKRVQVLSKQLEHGKGFEKQLMQIYRKRLQEVIKINETTKCRIIGLTLETRPDCINRKELIKFREMGVTRVQIGIQHLNERILDRVNRQCSTEKTIKAIRMLKDNCFKIDIHLMPDLPRPYLPGVYEEIQKGKQNGEEYVITRDDIDWDFDVYKADLEMFKNVIDGADFQADQWKIYPFQVTPYSQLEIEFKKGLHKSYVDNTENTVYGNQLVDLLIWIKKNAPRHVRFNRIVRDIPNWSAKLPDGSRMKYILGGIDKTNLRQVLLEIMKKEGNKCNCIRCREVKDQKVDFENAKLFVEKFESSGGDEYFLSFEDPSQSILYGFLRLRLSKRVGEGDYNDYVFDELKDCALIRELHVYGKNIAVNTKQNDASSQHLGFGTRLLEEAEKLAKENGYDKLAVIAGVGVKEYYKKKRDFTEGEYFLLKDI